MVSCQPPRFLHIWARAYNEKGGDGVKSVKRAFFLLLLIAFASEGLYLLDSSGYAQERGTRYFSKTGHNLEGAFFNYFQDKGGLEIFGYPITEGFQEDGFFVQYFERARLVLTGSRGKRASGSEEVKVAPLGELLGRRSPPFKPTYHFHYRYYPQTGHTLSFAFLDYYEAKEARSSSAILLPSHF